ncbi:MAG: phage antirepressor N-terminal domain-containing protein [Bacteroidota bacterium]
MSKYIDKTSASNPNYKFLQFNGKAIYSLDVEGEYWIAIKPICEALGVDYIAQYKAVKKNEILGQLLSEQTMVDSAESRRKMVCLPEKFIYGWLFSIRSESEELKRYKLECYEVLYNHFHGQIAGIRNLVSLREQFDTEVEDKKALLRLNDDFCELEVLEEKAKIARKDIKKRIPNLTSGQVELFN